MVERDSVLLVIDIQNDFLPRGALAVPGGDQVIPVVNRLAASFANVILTQDWHTPDHVSFATTHAGRQPFETITLPYGAQILWPVHCVQGSHGAEFATALDIPHAQAIVRKGYHAHTDSYSAFVEADRTTHTGLAGLLREREVGTVYGVGLATDFCVAWSLLDARRAGFHAVLIEDACRAIDTGGSLAAARRSLTEAGVRTMQSTQFD
jgi:nicotinamidase/pyrazinamidase